MRAAIVDAPCDVGAEKPEDFGASSAEVRSFGRPERSLDECREIGMLAAGRVTERECARVVCVSPEGGETGRLDIRGCETCHFGESRTIGVVHLCSERKAVERRQQKELRYQAVVRGRRLE